MNEFDLRSFLYNNPLLEKKEDSKKGNLEMQKKMEGAIRDNRDHKFDIDKDEDEQRKKLAKLKKDAKKESGKGKKGNKDEQKRAEGAIADAKRHKKALDGNIKADEKKLAKLKKDYKKDINESEEVTETPKLTKEGLKDMIREKITSILNEQEDDEVIDDTEETIEKNTDVEVKDDTTVKADIEDEVDIDDESAKSEMEIDSEIAGESPEKAAVLSLLTKAQEMVPTLGGDEEKNGKMVNQINNTITMFARDYLVQAPK